MEKYIIIFVILATIYYIQTQLNKTEGFESVPAQSVGGVDDTNAINTLAQIAKNLMAGGVTVPGNMIVQGDMALKGNMAVTGTMAVQSNMTVTGTTTLNGAVKGMLSIVDTSGPIKISSIYNNNEMTLDAITIDPKKNEMNIMSIKNSQIKSQTIYAEKITINDSLMLPMLYRKHDTAGYLYIRAYGYKVPLYYGFNMAFTDHNIKEAVRAKNKWPESMFSNTILDLRQANNNTDQNWVARYLVVFPGYKIRLYMWGGNNFTDKLGVKGVGEYLFPDNDSRIHGIYVALAEEQDPLATILF